MGEIIELEVAVKKIKPESIVACWTTESSKHTKRVRYNEAFGIRHDGFGVERKPLPLIMLPV